jgi:hypothetical protein
MFKELTEAVLAFLTITAVMVVAAFTIIWLEIGGYL